MFLWLFAAGEHAAGRGDVGPPRAAYEGGDVMVDQDLLELEDPLFIRRSERNPRIGVQRDQVDLFLESFEQSRKPLGVFAGIVDAVDQDILEGDSSPPFQRKTAAGIDQARDIPFPINGDEHVADRVGRGVEADRQVWDDRFLRETLEPGSAISRTAFITLS